MILPSSHNLSVKRETSTRDASHVMRAARRDPGGGEIPMKAAKPFAVCPESEAGSPVRDVEDKYDDAKRLLTLRGRSVLERGPTGLCPISVINGRGNAETISQL